MKSFEPLKKALGPDSQWLLESSKEPGTRETTIVGTGAEAAAGEDLTLAVLQSIDRHFSKQQIPIIYLNGLSLAKRYWPRTFRRPQGPIDLLVAPENFARAYQVLRSLGGKSRAGDSADALHFSLNEAHIIIRKALPLPLSFAQIRQKHGQHSSIPDLIWVEELRPELLLLLFFVSSTREEKLFSEHERKFDSLLLDIFFLIDAEKRNIDWRLIGDLFARFRAEKDLGVVLAILSRHFELRLPKYAPGFGNPFRNFFCARMFWPEMLRKQQEVYSPPKLLSSCFHLLRQRSLRWLY